MKKEIKMKMSMVVAAVLIIVVFAPLVMIWSLNVLFPVVAIPYTLETWCACTVFSALFLGNRK
jgi:hypothetical protein